MKRRDFVGGVAHEATAAAPMSDLDILADKLFGPIELRNLDTFEPVIHVERDPNDHTRINAVIDLPSEVVVNLRIAARFVEERLALPQL